MYVGRELNRYRDFCIAPQPSKQTTISFSIFTAISPPGPPHPSQNPLRTPHLPLPPPHPLTRHPTRPRHSLKRALAPMMIILPPQTIHMQRYPGRLCPTAQPMMYHLRAQAADAGVQEPEGAGAGGRGADEEGARGDVEHGAGEGFVERGVGVAEAGEGGAGAEGGGEGGAEGEERVFGCVVVVDCFWGKRGVSRVGKGERGKQGDVLSSSHKEKTLRRKRHNICTPLQPPSTSQNNPTPHPLTIQIPPHPHPQTPPRMLRPRMQHMIQKPNPRPYPNLLRIRHLRRMVF